MLKYFDGNLTIALEKALFESALLEDPLQFTTTCLTCFASHDKRSPLLYSHHCNLT